MELDYTLKKLERLYSVILEQGYRATTFNDYLTEKPEAKTVILRHDVDRRVKNSFKIAQLEDKMGIKASFYFRYIEGIFDEKVITDISGMGHEIGYHYETLSKSGGDVEEGMRLFRKELNHFRSLADVRTVCMHGSPLSRWDSRTLWETFDYHELGIIGEPYFDLDYNRVAYLTDTGRRWNAGRVSVRDKVVSAFKYHLRNTDDVIGAFKENRLPDTVMINIHPHRWHESVTSWATELIGQNLKNTIKYFIGKSSKSLDSGNNRDNDKRA